MTKENNLQIAHLVLSLDVGGLEILVCQMVRHLRESGCAPIIICLDSKGSLAEEMIQLGIDVHCLSRKPGFVDIQALLKLKTILCQYKIKLIHSHNQEAHFYSVLVRLFGSFRVIHTQHGVEPPYDWKKKLKCRVTGRFIETFVGVSQDIVNLACENHWVKQSQARLILNGVDTSLFCPDKSHRHKTRKLLNLEDEDDVLICVARLSPIKNHIHLIEVFADIASKRANVKLLVVGGGPQAEGIEQHVKDLHLCELVTMTGESRKIRELLQASDIFVLASLSEGINVSLLEAMSCGLVPVVTNVGGNGEIVSDSENGFLVKVDSIEDFSTKLNTALSDKNRRENMAKCARERVNKAFGLQKMMSQYMQIYFKKDYEK